MTYTPPPAAPQPYHPQPGPLRLKRQWWKAGWFIALAAAIVGIGIGAASGSAKTKTVAGPTTTATATETATSTVTATPTVIKTIATHVVTATVTYTPPPVNQFSDGTYRIGPDVPAGVYKTDGKGDGSGTGCYYAVLNSLNTTDIASNNNFDGPTVVQLPSSEAAFEVSGGCTWSRVG